MTETILIFACGFALGFFICALVVLWNDLRCNDGD